MKNSPAFLETLNDFMGLLKIIMFLVFIMYAFSGVTLVKPGEVAMILRLGALVGNNRAEQQNPPGWLFALPYPIDETIKVPEKEVREIEISELSINKSIKEEDLNKTINPLEEGYCISGDLNIFQVSASIKFQISDPAKAMFNYHGGFKTLFPFLQAATVQELTHISAGYPIEGILTDSKEEIALKAKENVQSRLDRMEAGINLLSIDLAEVSPPAQLKVIFEDVNSAYIKRKNFINDSLSEREKRLPKARAVCQKTINEAHSYHEEIVSKAQAEAGNFLEMLAAYKESPVQIHKDLVDKTRKKIFATMSNLTLLPGLKLCPADVRTIIENSRASALPYDDRDVLSMEEKDD